jgi:membrane associated rhomboid family serine protease
VPSLIPISDANPTRRTPFVTIALIVANIIAFFRQPGLGEDPVASSTYYVDTAPIPCQLQDACPRAVDFGLPGGPLEIPQRGLGSFMIAVLFSLFLHAGFLHIAGNMLFLWIFGNNVEDHLGHFRYLLFYLAGGIVAAFAHIFTHLADAAPLVGASGAVAAVMGAYLLLFPHARVKVLIPIFILWTVVQLSAWLVLGLWFLYQFLIGAQELTGTTGIAWLAHVGGFVFGLVGIFILGGRPHERTPTWRSSWRY